MNEYEENDLLPEEAIRRILKAVRESLVESDYSGYTLKKAMRTAEEYLQEFPRKNIADVRLTVLLRIQTTYGIEIIELTRHDEHEADAMPEILGKNFKKKEAFRAAMKRYFEGKNR